MRIPSVRDIFVVHSQREPRHASLYASLSEWCKRVGLGVVAYQDWEWAPANDPPPDELGGMPTDPWCYMPVVNTEMLHFWWRRCQVVLVVESHPENKHSPGVALELAEISRLSSSTPPPAIVVATSFGPSPSDDVRPFATAFLQLSSPDDVRVHSLVAVTWLVSRLQRSGRIGLEILDAARRNSRSLDRIFKHFYFGPFWRDLPAVDHMASPAPEDSWWPDAANLHVFMTREGAAELGAAWRSLADAIVAR